MSDNFAEKYKNWHQKISYAKSAIRIVGAIAAIKAVTYPSVDVTMAVILLAGGIFIAELLGIAEEWI